MIRTIQVGRKRARTIAMLAAVPLAAAGAVGAAGFASASAPPDHKVTLCHRTGAEEGGNTHAGYSIITVDIASVANAKDVRGHDSHDQVGNGPVGDIIPSYWYGDFHYLGKNLGNGGQAILDAGCQTPTPSPSPS